MIIIDAPILKTGLCYGLGVGPVPFVAMSSLFPQVKLLPSLATIVFIQQFWLIQKNMTEECFQ